MVNDDDGGARPDGSSSPGWAEDAAIAGDAHRAWFAVVDQPLPPRFRVGGIVRRLDDGAETRGIVVAHLTAADFDPARRISSEMTPALPDDFVISHLDSPSTQTVGRCLGWEAVPEDEWTTRERVRNLSLTWGRSPTHADDDSYEWHLLSALLPYDRWLEATEFEWPDVTDLGLCLAEWIDEWSPLIRWVAANPPPPVPEPAPDRASDRPQ